MSSTVPLVDLRAQYASIKPEVNAAIQRVLDHTGFIMGAEVQAFEEAFAGFIGAREAAGVASGTAALHLSLLACGIGPGDEVITTAFSFYATAEAISQAGATPVFVDVCRDTYNIDPRKIEAAITPRSRAIIPVHLYGQAADMDEVIAIARRRGLRVIEDAAQAHGAMYRDRRCGSIGDIACFSFYPSKNLGCYGDGGMVTSDDPDLIARVRRLRDHGRVGKYEHVEMGWGYRLDAIQAAVLAAKLPHLERWTEMRRKAARRYDQLLAGSSVIIPVERPYNRHVFHCYVVSVPQAACPDGFPEAHPEYGGDGRREDGAGSLGGSQRDRLARYLTARGIGVGVHYPIPLHRQPVYLRSALGHSPEMLAGSESGVLRPATSSGRAFPEAEAAAEQVLSLPMFPEITEEQQQRVTSEINAFLQAVADDETGRHSPGARVVCGEGRARIE